MPELVQHGGVIVFTDDRRCEHMAPLAVRDRVIGSDKCCGSQAWLEPVDGDRRIDEREVARMPPKAQGTRLHRPPRTGLHGRPIGAGVLGGATALELGVSLMRRGRNALCHLTTLLALPLAQQLVRQPVAFRTYVQQHFTSPPAQPPAPNVREHALPRPCAP
jgi:hypothetical protein